MAQYQISLGATDLERAEHLAGVLESVLGEQASVTWFEVEEGAKLADATDAGFGVASPDGRWAVDGFIEADEPQLLATAVRDAFADLDVGPITVRPVEDKDWVGLSLAGLGPVVAGRFVVHGAHDRDRLPDDKLALEIEANQAFGSGHHPTTAGCLIALSEHLQHRRSSHGVAGVLDDVLDLGCGSGVLALAYAKATGLPALASDIDPTAVAIATGNIGHNGAGHLVKVMTATGFDHPLLQSSRYGLVFANILAGPLVGLAPEMAKRLVPGGTAILSGLLRTQEREVISAYRRAGFMRQRSIRLGDWVTLIMRRP